MPMPAIIAATDFTPRSAHVGNRAAMIAELLRSRLILAHSVSSAPADADQAASDTHETHLFAAEAAPGKLTRIGRSLRLLPRGLTNPEAALRDLAHHLGPEVEIRLLRGAVDVSLSNLAEEEAALMLVLGLHRERRVLDVLRLTTMERIVLAATVPVLIAHQRPRDGYRRVLAPTDFSPASAAALRMAARIAPKASFHAIHALQVPLGARFSPGDAATDAALTRAEQLRTAFLAMPDLPEFAEPPEIVPGGVHEVLAFRQNELRADLLCIGTHSGRDPLQLGNYARDLMRAPPTDLLVAKP